MHDILNKFFLFYRICKINDSKFRVNQISYGFQLTIEPHQILNQIRCLGSGCIDTPKYKFGVLLLTL